MPFKRAKKLAKQYIQEIRGDAEEIAIERGEAAGKKAILILKGLFEQTFAGWNGHNDSGRAGWRDLGTPTFEKSPLKVKFIRRGVRGNKILIQLTVWAGGPGGQDHPLWYYLDLGNQGEGGNYPNGSAPFPIRWEQRFKEAGPGTLDFGSYSLDGTEEWAQIPPGGSRAPFGGVRISDRIWKKFLEKINGDPVFEDIEFITPFVKYADET